MSQDGVSPVQGNGPLARGGVSPASVHSLHRSIPILTSQFRGPFVYNETDEERKKREAEEAKQKEDDEKKSNFKKVQEAREKAEKERDQLLQEKKDREAKDKAAADKKLVDDGNLQALADSKTKEAADKAAEAVKEKARADAAEEKLKKIADAQEADLVELLKTIPKDKQPPLDPADPVEKRLAQAKYAASLLGTPKPGIGAGVRNQGDKAGDRYQELKDISKKRNLTKEEAMELMEVSPA